MTNHATRDPERHQWAASELVDDFHRHDLAQLATLRPEQRARQVAARAELAVYVDEMWMAFKRRGIRPGDQPELYNSVAAMRDLTHHLAYGVGEGPVLPD